MDFKEALTFRHACKVFDEYKIIEESDFIDILNAGVLAPSSMGLEPWEFEVVRDGSIARANPQGLLGSNPNHKC